MDSPWNQDIHVQWSAIGPGNLWLRTSGYQCPMVPIDSFHPYINLLDQELGDKNICQKSVKNQGFTYSLALPVESQNYFQTIGSNTRRLDWLCWSTWKYKCPYLDLISHQTNPNIQCLTSSKLHSTNTTFALSSSWPCFLGGWPCPIYMKNASQNWHKLNQSRAELILTVWDSGILRGVSIKSVSH